MGAVRRNAAPCLAATAANFLEIQDEKTGWRHSRMIPLRVDNICAAGIIGGEFRI